MNMYIVHFQPGINNMVNLKQQILNTENFRMSFRVAAIKSS